MINPLTKLRLVDYIFILCPERIILGGGVMKEVALFEPVRNKVYEKINGYIKLDKLERMEEYIVPASLGGKQGILGALSLAIGV